MTIWPFAAELQGETFRGPGHSFGDQFADRGGTGESNLVDPRMIDDAFPETAVPGDDVDHSLGQAGVLERFPRGGGR